MRFSTGKVTGLKHATGLDMQKLAKLKRKAKALKHSTGEQSHMKHATGKEYDYKVDFEELSEEDDKSEEGKEQEKNKGE